MKISFDAEHKHKLYCESTTVLKQMCYFKRTKYSIAAGSHKLLRLCLEK